MSTSTTESRTVKFDGVPVELTNGPRSTSQVDPEVWDTIDGTKITPTKDDAVAVAMRERRAQSTLLPSRWKRIRTTIAGVLNAMAVTNPPFSAVYGGYTQAQVDQYRNRAEILRPRW